MLKAKWSECSCDHDDRRIAEWSFRVVERLRVGWVGWVGHCDEPVTLSEGHAQKRKRLAGSFCISLAYRISWHFVVTICKWLFPVEVARNSVASLAQATSYCGAFLDSMEILAKTKALSPMSQSGKSNQKRKNQTEMMNEEHVTKTMEQLKSMRYRSYSSDKPWLDAEGELIWSQSRVQAAKLVFSQSFETCMGLIIVGNLMLIVYEANESAKCFPDYANNVTECPFRSEANLWLYVTNILLLVTFSMECMLRAYVERGAYVWNKWNCIDLFTVLAGWVGVAASNVFNATLLRMFRLVRVVRALRVLISVPEFYLLITGLYSSIKAIIFGALMLVAVIIFWAVISVELLHPIASSLTWDECPRCPDGFRGIFAASLTLFQQIVAGDSWGEISIRLVEAKPWTSILLFSMLITISLGMLNLILAETWLYSSQTKHQKQSQTVTKHDGTWWNMMGHGNFKREGKVAFCGEDPLNVLICSVFEWGDCGTRRRSARKWPWGEDQAETERSLQKYGRFGKLLCHWADFFFSWNLWGQKTTLEWCWMHS